MLNEMIIALIPLSQQYIPHPASRESPWICLRLAGASISQSLHWQAAGPNSPTEGEKNGPVYVTPLAHLLGGILTRIRTAAKHDDVAALAPSDSPNYLGYRYYHLSDRFGQ